MKKIVFIAVILIATACSTTKTVTQNTIDKYKTLTPPEGKAIVYFVRPNVLIDTYIPFKVKCNDTLIVSTTGNKYLFVFLEPNKYKFVSEAENKAVLELQIESGKIYYIEQRPIAGLIARNLITLLTDEEGKQILAKCSLSSKFTPPAFNN